MLTRINGHLTFFRNDLKITKTKRPGHWLVIRGQTTYEVEGGRPAGGRSNEWFVTCPDVWTGTIYTKSLAESLRLIDGA